MQEEAQDAVKAQARQAIKVLRREAQAAGLKQKDSDALTPELMRLGDEPAMTQEPDPHSVILTNFTECGRPLSLLF